MQDIYISIGQNIRRRRKEKHLTQESLAANVETSAQYISRIERGQLSALLLKRSANSLTITSK